MLKKLTILLLTIAMLLGHSSFQSYARGKVSAHNASKQQDIVLIFDNDVHGHVEGYPKISAYKQEMLQQTPYVTLISLGDFAQGSIFCAASKGVGITTLMNKAGYDLITVGNHEFDYGIPQLDTIVANLNAQTICCNFEDLEAKKLYFPASTIFTYGDVTIGFVGMVAPLTETSDSPKSYYDANGKKIFSFHSGDFYRLVQREVNKLRSQGVNYVIALSHLGDNPFVVDNSIAMVSHTRGIDVVLDSHSHSFLPDAHFTNVDGKLIPVVSTGCWFKHIGKLTITPEGEFIPEMIPTESYEAEDATVSLTIDSLRSQFSNTPILAHSDFPLYGFDQDITYDRNSQTNLGLLAADAFRVRTGADIGWINAGGIRQTMPAGDIRIKDIMACFPFFNNLCVVECTGQVILDALEYGVNRYPYDFGSFPQVSGVRYKLDPTVPSPVRMDLQERLLGFKPNARRRVSGVEIMDPITLEYAPLAPNGTYTVATIDYLAKFHGSGDVFANGRIIEELSFSDSQAIEEYFVLELFGHVGEEYDFIKNDFTK